MGCGILSASEIMEMRYEWMFLQRVSSEVSLKIIEKGDASALFLLIEENRTDLKQWFRWAETTLTVAAEVQFIEYIRGRYNDDAVLPVTILYRGEVAGMIDLHNIDLANKVAEIGYWLGLRFQHRGIMQAALLGIEKIAFGEYQLNRLGLKANADNLSSRHTAIRAGYEFEGIERAGLISGGKINDVAVYSKISSNMKMYTE